MRKKLDLENILNSGDLIKKKNLIFSIDERKAFLKLSRNQFEDPLDSIREIIANAIDSYPESDDNIIIRLNKLKNDKGEYLFSIEDYGCGMNDKKLKFLVTLGLSDKSRENIGRFGIGFSSIFNPKLNIKKVIVDTKKDKEHYQLVFNIKEDEIPSIENYKIKTPIKYGTKITLISDKESVVQEMKNKAEKICKFLPYKVILNGKETKKEKLRIDNKKGININEEGLIGYIKIGWRDRNKLTLLSKYLLVESKECGKLKDPYFGELYFPYIEGVINNNSFNLVISRNEIIEDDEYNKFKDIIHSKGSELLSKLLDEYKNDNWSFYKEIILRNITNFLKTGFIYEYLVNKKDIIDILPYEEYHTKRLLEKIIDAEVFELWDGRDISLKEINKRIRNNGHILVTDKEHLANMIDEKDLHNVLIKYIDNTYLESYNQDQISRIYKQKPFIELNEENVKSLADQEIIKLKQSGELYNKIDDNLLNKRQIYFLNHVRNLLNLNEVKKIKRKYGFPNKVDVEYTKLDRNNIIASYDNKINRIYLNLNNDVIKMFIRSKNHKENVMYFIPILSHELVHNNILNHFKNFYIENSSFDTDMRKTIADYKINLRF